MVSELRRLTFSEIEIRSALIDFCYRTNIEWPKANVERIEPGGDSIQFLTIVFGRVYSASQRFEEIPDIVLSRDQVFAALLLFCKKHRIHLKRDSEKSVSFDDRGNLLLEIEASWATD